MEQRAVILVKGRVQGVYFRASTTQTATELGIKGHVENLADGSVRIVAEGTTKNLEKLIEWCGQGQRWSPFLDSIFVFLSVFPPTHNHL